VTLGLTVITLRDRAARRQEGWFRPYPIPKVALDAFDQRFRPDQFGPTLATEVVFLGRGSMIVPGGTSDTEAWVLCVLAKGAKALFEFGTCTGKTAYLWARNAPDAAIATLTLPPDAVARTRREAGDAEQDVAAAVEESRFTRFLYSGTDVEPRITQLFGDSKGFDETPWVARCDLVFVDGSHAYSYVRNDSAKAIRMVRPGGVVLWHDYTSRIHGVFRGLNELARQLPLVHLAGTSLVAYRRPAT
jgi:predicted O-methyltransferase YrrM